MFLFVKQPRIRAMWVDGECIMIVNKNEEFLIATKECIEMML